MKKNIIFICLIALAFIGCQRDDSYDAPNSFSDVGWIFSDVEGVLDVNIGDYITFTDASQGYEHHEWEIAPGNFYLEHPLTRNDRGDSILRTKISGSGKSTDKIVSVFFDKPGLQSVRLFNIFPDSVTFRGKDDFRYASKKVGDKWVIDTTFMVDVYARILPKVQVDHANGTEVWEAPTNFTTQTKSTNTFTQITVEAGDKVDFTDLSEVGRSEAVSWRIINQADLEPNANFSYEDGSGIGNTQNLSYTFSSLGTYFIGMSASREADNKPGATSSVIIPYTFNVIPSSKPFEILGDVVELEDETIRVNFTGEFQNEIGQESHFTVNVNGTPFDIASVTTNGTFLDIKLTDPIYRPDVITVSYDGSSDLKSTDERSPVAFTNVPVIMHNVNLLEGSQINTEIAMFSTTWFAAQVQAPSSTEVFSTEQFVSAPSSAKHIVTPGKGTGMRANLDPAISKDDTKSYLVTFKMYIDPVSTVMPNRVALFDIPRWTPSSYLFTGSEPKGEWIDVEVILPPGQSSVSAILFRTDTTATSDATIYYDDVFMVEYEERP